MKNTKLFFESSTSLVSNIFLHPLSLNPPLIVKQEDITSAAKYNPPDYYEPQIMKITLILFKIVQK